MRDAIRRRATATAVVLLSGCTGTIVGDGASGAAAAPPASPAPSPTAAVAAVAAPASALRLLTRREYDNTVRDLLGDMSHPARAFVGQPVDPALGYSTLRPVGEADLESYRDAAEALARVAAARVSSFAPCPGGDDSACARAFIREFGRRAFRRPLAADETQGLEKLYQGVRASMQGSYSDGIRVLVTAMLQDPRFLYQRTWGDGRAADGSMALDPYDVASRLSYAFWRTMPDAALFAAADANRLQTPGDIGAQAARMLADPRAREATAAFGAQWMALDRLDSLSRPTSEYPDWSPALAASMRLEVESFLASAFLDRDGRVETLLTAPVGFVDRSLARVYGVAIPAAAGARVDLDPAQRAGVLTLPGVLTIYPTPVTRGKFAREQLLCRTIPPPPPNAQGMGKLASAGATERERVSVHASDPACAACHALMDPIGFAFLSYDAIGRWRAIDGGKPIDASGALDGSDVDGPFADGVRLARRLGTSAQVRRCLARRVFRFALDRAESPADTPALDTMTAALGAGTRPISDMLVALATSPAFRLRQPMPGEGTP